jgi:hypothetical protein
MIAKSAPRSWNKMIGVDPDILIAEKDRKEIEDKASDESGNDIR